MFVNKYYLPLYYVHFCEPGFVYYSVHYVLWYVLHVYGSVRTYSSKQQIACKNIHREITFNSIPTKNYLRSI